MVSRFLLFFLSILTLCHNGIETADICEILDANYCFYFSDSSCYINLCQCDACAHPDKVQNLLEDSQSNSTQEHLCPTWCPHLKSNETILNILGAGQNNSTELVDVSFECDDLRENCLSQKGYNGHCYFYEKNCEYNPEVAKKGKAKKSRNPHSAESCLKHQKTCARKYKGHFSCKQFRKHCKKYNLTEIPANNSTIVETVSPLEQCLNFQKICAAKYRKHFACRQYRKKCKPFNLPEIVFEDTPVTQTARHHNKQKVHRGHGVLVSGELVVGNETVVASS